MIRCHWTDKYEKKGQIVYTIVAITTSVLLTSEVPIHIRHRIYCFPRHFIATLVVKIKFPQTGKKPLTLLKKKTIFYIEKKVKCK